MSPLSDPALRRYLERYLRRRVLASDAEDMLQAVYCAALEARRRPTEGEELRRFMTVIARRKLAAHYERTSREHVGETPEIEAHPAPVEELSLLRWAESRAAECEKERAAETLEWMARESEGEKLEAIAAEVRVPASSVRQRVVRLRRFMRAQWALELAAAVAVVLAVLWWLSPRETQTVMTESVSPQRSPIAHALELREYALRSCEHGAFTECVFALDEAARLDPAGDADPRIVSARKRALEALTPSPTPPPPPVRTPKTAGTSF